MSNDTNRPIYDLILNYGAFQNPVSQNISDLSVLIDEQKLKVGALDANLLPNFTATDLQDIVNELDNLKTFITTTFSVHTNRLSGVTFNSDFLISKPDLSAILGVSVAIREIESDSDYIPSLFISLLIGGSILSNANDYITDMDLKIQESPPLPDYEFPNVIITKLQDFTSNLNDMITADDDTFESIIQKLRAWTLSKTLEKPSDEWKNFVVGNIATDELKELIS